MGYWVGIDVGKSFHWVSVLDDEGREVLSRKVFASEEDIEVVRSQIGALGAERAFFCVDMMGGPATLLEAVLQGHGERVFYLSGTALALAGHYRTAVVPPRPARFGNDARSAATTAPDGLARHPKSGGYRWAG